MSIFENRKAPANVPARDSLQVLRNALQALEAEPEQTPRIADLRRILSNRISELERQRNIIR
jgi:hypothetical protein